MCLYIKVPKKNYVNTFETESYYMHLHYLRDDLLGYWIITLILIKDWHLCVESSLDCHCFFIFLNLSNNWIITKFFSYFLFNVNNHIICTIFIFHFTNVHISIQKSSQTFISSLLCLCDEQPYCLVLVFTSFLSIRKNEFTFIFYQYTYL